MPLPLPAAAAAELDSPAHRAAGQLCGAGLHLCGELLGLQPAGRGRADGCALWCGMPILGNCSSRPHAVHTLARLRSAELLLLPISRCALRQVVICFVCVIASQDYLSELEEPMSTIYSKSQIDRAMTVAYNQTRVSLGPTCPVCMQCKWRQLAAANGRGMAAPN